MGCWMPRPLRGPTVKAPIARAITTTTAATPASSTLFGGLAISFLLYEAHTPGSRRPLTIGGRGAPAARAAGYLARPRGARPRGGKHRCESDACQAAPRHSGLEDRRGGATRIGQTIFVDGRQV